MHLPGSLHDRWVFERRRLRATVNIVLRDCGLPDGWTWWDWSDWTIARPRGYVQVLTVEQYDESIADRIFDALDGGVFGWAWQTFGVMVFYIDREMEPDLHAWVDHDLQAMWIRGLVAPDLAAVHREVFDWFAQGSHRMDALNWREFEELVAASLAGQGMTVTLGPGRADRGIDIRLVRHEVFGDVLTAVQVKSGRTPVELLYVQALAAASIHDGNDESLFVTSSRYLPGARDFARSWEAGMKHRYTLATSDDVVAWVKAARDRSWYPDRRLRDPSPCGSGDLVGHVLVSTSVSLIINTFGLVVRQTPRAVLMLVLSTDIVAGDRQRGREVPRMPTEFSAVTSDELLAARRDSETPTHWWDIDGHLFTTWNGTSLHFDTMD
ncbi:MAG TPA: restriction endonuclease [Solirubrobacteraceae bacterium]|jgi:restriction system protein|nr:restriction endonuclease [Solirubrobacteraceae bacterium]